MPASDPKSLPAIGFLTVIEHAEHGLFGGYLLLNISARPIEFHCTAPVRPNRAQEILYGPTLKPFLYGEQIGHTLVTRAKTQPLIVCTDVEPALAVRELVSLPVVLVAEKQNSETGDDAADRSFRVDEPHREAAPKMTRLLHFSAGPHQLGLPREYESDKAEVMQCYERCQDTLDLNEPFERIREAIEEAQKSTR